MKDEKKSSKIKQKQVHNFVDNQIKQKKVLEREKK